MYNTFALANPGPRPLEVLTAECAILDRLDAVSEPSGDRQPNGFQPRHIREACTIPLTADELTLLSVYLSRGSFPALFVLVPSVTFSRSSPQLQRLNQRPNDSVKRTQLALDERERERECDAVGLGCNPMTGTAHVIQPMRHMPRPFKLADWFHEMTPPAQRICVGISSSRLDTHTPVQEVMVVLVLTDHERRILGLRTIGMVHHRSCRERMPKRRFSTQPMDEMKFTFRKRHSVSLYRAPALRARYRAVFSSPAPINVLRFRFKDDTATFAGFHKRHDSFMLMATAAQHRAVFSGHTLSDTATFRHKGHAALLTDFANLRSSHAVPPPSGMVWLGAQSVFPHRCAPSIVHAAEPMNA